MDNCKKICVLLGAIATVFNSVGVDVHTEFGLQKGKISLETAKQIAGAKNAGEGDSLFVFETPMTAGAVIKKTDNQPYTITQADINEAIKQMRRIESAYKAYKENPILGVSTGGFTVPEILYEMINWPEETAPFSPKLPLATANDEKVDTKKVLPTGFSVMYKNAIDTMIRKKLERVSAERETALRQVEDVRAALLRVENIKAEKEKQLKVYQEVLLHGNSIIMKIENLMIRTLRCQKKLKKPDNIVSACQRINAAVLQFMKRDMFSWSEKANELVESIKNDFRGIVNQYDSNNLKGDEYREERAIISEANESLEKLKNLLAPLSIVATRPQEE